MQRGYGDFSRGAPEAHKRGAGESHRMGTTGGRENWALVEWSLLALGDQAGEQGACKKTSTGRGEESSRGWLRRERTKGNGSDVSGIEQQ